MNTTVGFIGLGLIGGSIAKALKKSDSEIYTIAYSRSRQPLEAAVCDGVINEIADNIDDTFKKCDIVFLCTPVEYNSDYLMKLSTCVKPECIITDVGSVKGYIHKTVSELGLESNFIGGHPMAGSEKTGYMAASDILLENAYYAITPTAATTNKALEFYIDLVKKTGAIPIITEPETHDYAVAGISHVPHLIASSLVNMVRQNDTNEHLMKTLAAGGFKDITRIASSSADVWSQICHANKEQISLVLQKYIDLLTEVKEYVDADNKAEIYDMFSESKEYRDSISIKTKGPISNNYVMFCDIEDKEGALSKITLLLSDNHIKIKNIEIIHNREYKQGALLIAFYDDHCYNRAFSLLSENGYFIHK